MPHTITTTKTTKRNRLALLAGGVVILALLFAACGAAGSATTSSTPARTAQFNTANTASQSSHSMASPAQPQAPNTASTSTTGNGSTPAAGQYLIKSLAVNMEVKDTRRVAADLQAWISTTDPGSSSEGTDYEQVGDNLYSVSMQFEVRATVYTQIKLYLEEYTTQHGGSLLSLHETVQDVTNDYIDSQSRLRNLRGEQQRLLTLLGNTTTLGDILSIEQRLTDVEGQIEDTEAHLNALNGQTTFYSVSINLQPITGTPPPPPPNNAWNGLKTLQAAWSASLAFGEALATLFIWLLTFSIYIIPAGVIAWFVWQRRRTRLVAPMPAPHMMPPSPAEL
jgi:hypothetical protein